MSNNNPQTPFVRARSRLSDKQRETLQQTLRSKKRAEQQKKAFQQLGYTFLEYCLRRLPLLVLLTAASAGLFLLLTTISPSSVANIPATNSYGPFLLLSWIISYLLFEFIANSKKIASVIATLITVLFFAQFQHIELSPLFVTGNVIISAVLSFLWIYRRQT